MMMLRFASSFRVLVRIHSYWTFDRWIVGVLDTAGQLILLLQVIASGNNVQPTPLLKMISQIVQSAFQS
jgi:hypothetical protein